MATALKPNPRWRGDPTFLPDVLRAFGVEFRELPGWLYWGMGDFNVIQGVIWHHTGARNTSAGYIARNAGLSGALSSQFHTAPDGLQTLCGVGIAWHAGAGSYPGWRKDMANWDAIGFEMQHNGTDPWPEAQLESTRRATAAILWFLGKRATTLTMLSHWEYSLARQGKWDPGSGKGFAPRWANDKEAMMDMNVQRAKVNELIDRFNRYGTLDPVPEKEEGLFMGLSPERQEDLAAKIDRIHHELTHEFQSLVEDEHGKRSQWRGTLVGMMLQVDKKVEAMHAHMLPGVITKIQELFKKGVQDNG